MPIDEVPSHVRKAVDVQAKRNASLHQPPPGMPLDCPIDRSGTYADREAAVSAACAQLEASIAKFINHTFALRAKGWIPAISAATCKAPAKYHGKMHRVVCNKQGKHVSSIKSEGVKEREGVSHRCDCGYVLYIEECDDSVCVNEKSTFTHNHDLALEPAEQAARASTRDRITPETLADAAQAQKLLPKSTPAQIANFIREKLALASGVQPTWTNKDLANLLAPTSAESAFDSANFMEELRAMRAAGARVEVTIHSETREIRTAVVVFREGIVASEIDGEDTWTFDNTFGTNGQGYTVGLVTGITRLRRGYVKAVTFMDEESVENFELVLRVLLLILGKPNALFTDGCPKILAAIVLVFGMLFASTCHFLCVWHISNNIYEHIRPLFGAVVRGAKASGSVASRKWWAFNRMFWRLAKMSDWQDRDSRFASKFTELRQMIVDLRYETNAKVIDHQLEWLGDPLVADAAQPLSLYARRRKWALLFCDIFTFGSVSTQLGESMNKGLKMLVRPKTMTLAELALKCQTFANQRIAADEVAAVQGMYRLAAKSKACTSPLLIDLQKRVLLGERPFNFCEAQLARMPSYSATPRDEEAARDFLQTWPWPNGAASELSDTPADGQAESRADARAEARAGASMDAPANGDGAAGCYSPVPDAALPRTLYAVKFQSMGSGSTEAEAEVSAIELLLADHCVPSVLEETHLTHICCTTWCTCLIFRRWGLPCAHMFRAMFAENLVCVPNGVVHRRWLPNDAERAKNLARLRSSTVSQGAYVHDLKERSDELTADERYDNLMAASKVVADVGSLSAPMYKVVMTQLAEMLAKARAGTLVPDSKGLRQQAAAARIAKGAKGRAARAQVGQGVDGAPAADEAEEELDLLVVNRSGKSDMGKRKRSAASIAKDAATKAAKKAAKEAKAAANKAAAATQPKP